jgi:FtsH-binding integral membrane protein
MLSTETVWNRRTTADELVSDSTYNLTIGGVLLWGFMINWLMVEHIDPAPIQAFQANSPWIFMGLYFLSIIAGTLIYSKSDNPGISFIGYNFIVLPLGLVLVAMLPFFEAEVISRAFLATGSITGIMMLAGAAYPKVFLSIGRALFFAFIATFIVEMGFAFFTGKSPAIFDWIMVLIFSGYIGYDWARAQALPKTLDNAVDCAASLYVDIVILFMRLLRIFSRR